MAIEAQEEHFIPITRFALIDRLSQSVGSLGSSDYGRFLRYLAACRHQGICKNLQRLKELYFPFSPDRDTIQVLEYDELELANMQDELIREFPELLVQANYTQVTQQDLEAILSSDSGYGLQLKVDLSEFDNVLIFSRGSSIETEERRTLKSLFLRKEIIEVPTFQRLFLLLKLKPEAERIQEVMATLSIKEKKARKRVKKYRGMLPKDMSSDHIYLKTFKNIPQINLEMLFPNTQVRFKLMDKLRLGVTAGGGTVGSVVGTVTKLTAAANPLAILGLLLGLGAVIFRQVMKFFTQRTKYMMVLAQQLYFHSLANNRGVLTLMADRAEDEEIKESYLLYHFLLHSARLHNRESVKADIEAFLETEFGIKINFDITNPLAALAADKLLVEREDKSLIVAPPAEALVILEELWKGAIYDS